MTVAGIDSEDDHLTDPEKLLANAVPPGLLKYLRQTNVDALAQIVWNEAFFASGTVEEADKAKQEFMAQATPSSAHPSNPHQP